MFICQGLLSKWVWGMGKIEFVWGGGGGGGSAPTSVLKGHAP